MSWKFRQLAVVSAIVLSMSVSVAQPKELVILHTNDTHSQIEPNSATASRNPDEGGLVRRAAAIDQVRKQNPNVILVDAGDFVQGSPYYNFFKGEVEIKMMNKLGYNVGTLGNHEFDNGIEELARLLAMAEFPFVCANYDVAGTVLEPYIKKTVVLERGGLKIGFIGLGVNPDGLIAKKNMGGIKYLDPVETANKYAAELKATGCDMVVVVSHIGYFAEEDNAGDRLIAKESTDIDLIIGGHSHTDLKGCVTVTNRNGKPVSVTQTGKSGFRVGRINIDFGK